MSNEPKEITPEEKWEKATIANHFIFYKIMQNNHDVCKELLEILMNTHGSIDKVMDHLVFTVTSHIRFVLNAHWQS